MIHDLDLARWTAGEVATASAVGSGVTTGSAPSRSSSTHINGAITYVTGTWARPGTPFRTTFDVAGTAGILRHDSAQHPPLITASAEPTPGGLRRPGTAAGLAGRVPVRDRDRRYLQPSPPARRPG